MGTRRVLLTGVAVASLVACGAEASETFDRPEAPPAAISVESGTEPPAAVPPATTDATPAPVEIEQSPVGQAPAAERTLVIQELEQPAIWPAADVVFATPDEAASDFVEQVLVPGAMSELGPFQAGDARSGEIVVFSPGDSPDAEPSERGLVLLRQLGPDDGWFVIAATSDGATIETPTAGSVVTAGALSIAGEARGFEGTVIVSAFPAGDAGTTLDQLISRGGPLADLEPYSETLDLSNAMPGEVVVLLVQGDSGLGSDPSSFASIPVVVENVIPPTR